MIFSFQAPFYHLSSPPPPLTSWENSLLYTCLKPSSLMPEVPTFFCYFSLKNMGSSWKCKSFYTKQTIPKEESKDSIITWTLKLSKRAHYEKFINPYMKRKEELSISNFLTDESTYLQKTLAKRSFFFYNRVSSFVIIQFLCLQQRNYFHTYFFPLRSAT